MKSIEGKIPYHLIPTESMEQFALAMKDGADKYEENDWRKKNGMPWSWLCASALRHSWALMRGHNFDEKSGLHHGAHLMCIGAMLIYYCTYPKTFNLDDRFKQPRG